MQERKKFKITRQIMKCRLRNMRSAQLVAAKMCVEQAHQWFKCVSANESAPVHHVTAVTNCDTSFAFRARFCCFYSEILIIQDLIIQIDWYFELGPDEVLCTWIEKNSWKCQLWKSYVYFEQDLSLLCTALTHPSQRRRLAILLLCAMKMVRKSTLEAEMKPEQAEQCVPSFPVRL